jgi:hypothetical protein
VELVDFTALRKDFPCGTSARKYTVPEHGHCGRHPGPVAGRKGAAHFSRLESASFVKRAAQWEKITEISRYPVGISRRYPCHLLRGTEDRWGKDWPETYREERISDIEMTHDPTIDPCTFPDSKTSTLAGRDIPKPGLIMYLRLVGIQGDLPGGETKPEEPVESRQRREEGGCGKAETGSDGQPALSYHGSGNTEPLHYR